MRVLIVEDDERISGVLRRYLGEHSYAVDVAAAGREGLESAQMVDYDVIILDVMLPGMDGFAVCRELRRQHINTPVLMLTARDAVTDRVSGLDSGADDYLTKPFALGELAARIRALARRRSGRNPLLTIADLSINTVTREVQRGGKPIELSTREYVILEHLARNLGKIVTRANLEEHIWNQELQPNSNIVDVYVARIRRKLDDDQDLKLLETVRGVGYRLRLPQEAKLCSFSAASVFGSPPGTPWRCWCCLPSLSCLSTLWPAPSCTTTSTVTSAPMCKLPAAHLGMAATMATDQVANRREAAGQPLMAMAPAVMMLTTPA